MFYGLLRELDPYNTDWIVFKNQLDNFFSANNITNDETKRALLLNILDQETYRLLLTLSHPSKPETFSFDTLLSMLDRQFDDAVTQKRFELVNATRAVGEPLEEWVARVKDLARGCGSGPEMDEICKEVFLCGLNNPGWIQVLEEKAGASFEEVVDFVMKNEGSIGEELDYSGQGRESYFVFDSRECYYFDPHHF